MTVKNFIKRISPRGRQFLDIDAGYNQGGDFQYYPLHGSIDLEGKEIPRKEGKVKEIEKVPPSTLTPESDPFMIYPLEAVGYESTVQSPYLDLLLNLKKWLEKDVLWIVIGFSFRNPTITSLFETVIKKRRRNGDEIPIFPQGAPLDERKEEIRESKPDLGFFVIDSHPEEIIERLRGKGFHNTSRAIIPIEVKLPSFFKENGELLNPKDYGEKLGEKLERVIKRIKRYKLTDPGYYEKKLRELGIGIPLSSSRNGF